MAEQVFAVDLDEAAENESFTLLSFVVARRWRLLWNYFPYTLCLLHSLRSALYLTKPLNKQFMFFSTSLYTFWLHEIFTGEGKEEPREKGAEEASERNFSSLLSPPSFDCNLQHRKDFRVCAISLVPKRSWRALDFEEMWKHFLAQNEAKDGGARVRLENVRDETVLGLGKV
jgi:hypothetical protein